MQPLFIVDILKEGFIGILLMLDTLIYGLIASAFRIFMALASARLLSSETYTEVANKIYIVVGVFMLFVIAYSLLKGIVDPDKELKESLGPGMLRNVVTAVVGLAVTPFIFNLMYQAQGLFLENDVLARIFFVIGDSNKIESGGESVDPDDYVDQVGGALTAASLWQAFFYPAEDSGKDADDIEANAFDYYLEGALELIGCAAAAGLTFYGAVNWWNPVGWATLLGAAVAGFLCISARNDIAAGDEASAAIGDDGTVTLAQAYAIAESTGDFGIFTVFLENYVDDGDISYYWGISTIAGAFALYSFVSFSIDMGIRAAKLAYLQIIAPIPLILNILPKYKDSFKKYVDSVISTFLEVFIRISVVYIVVYMICHLPELFSSMSAFDGKLKGMEVIFAKALLILGLVAFCRRAPDMIGELLHIPKGSMSLGIGKKIAEGSGYAAGAIAGAGATAAVRNFTGSRSRGRNLAQSVFNAGRGFVGGAGRATLSQFNPMRAPQPVNSFDDMRKAAGEAAEKANDAFEHVADRHDAFNSARNDYRSATDDYNKALAEVENAERDIARFGADSVEGKEALKVKEAAEEKMKAALARRQKARDLMTENDALGELGGRIQTRVTAWATGTVDMKVDDAAIKFGSALDDLKGTAREEAFKKDNVSKALRARQAELEGRTVSEYKDGWDEDSYNSELRRRLENDDDYGAARDAYNIAQADMTSKRDTLGERTSELESRRSELDTAKKELYRLRSSGASATDIATAQARLTAAEGAVTAAEAARTAAADAFNDANTVFEEKRTALDGRRSTVTADFDKVARKSELELSREREQLEQDKKAAKDAAEAAADAWIAANADSNDNLKKLYNDFLADHMDFISTHGNYQMDVGDGTKRSVSEIITSAFGSDASSGRVDTGMISSNEHRKFTLETADGKEIHYTWNGSQFVNDADPGDAYSNSDFFNVRVQNNVKQGGKVTAHTTISDAAEEGKNAKNLIPTSEEYRRKVTRKRQAEEGKKR